MTLDLDSLVERVWARDHTVWMPEPTEISNRLGWLDVMDTMIERTRDLWEFADDVLSDQITTCVLLGMGGSSLAPEVIRTVYGARGVDLLVMDTTHPAAVRRLEGSIDVDHTLFVVASKSGTTTETLSHLASFSQHAPPERFVAITDPGTPLEERARAAGFRAVFTNPPDIGGRYSALSLFGLVPAALIGADLDALLEGARTMAAQCRAASIGKNPGAALGVALGEAALIGRDKATIALTGPGEALGPWIEQLIAESTGKQGRGIVPVVGERPGAPTAGDRIFVVDDEAGNIDDPVITLPPLRAEDLGGAFFRWEFATAIAGAVLGINPFDQPNVEQSKAATRDLLSGGDVEAADAPAVEPVLDGLRQGDYLAIQAFVDPSEANARRLEAWRAEVSERYGVATTLGFGPRFLHSTGQLHKGGPDSVVCVQVLDDVEQDVPIPGAPYTFGELLRAQAAGDLLALKAQGRRVASARLDEM